MGRRRNNINLDWSAQHQNLITDDPYVNLAYAITKQACDDYAVMYKNELLHKKSPEHISRYTKRFLFSDWPEYYTGIPGRVLMEKIEQDVRKEMIERGLIHPR